MSTCSLQHRLRIDGWQFESAKGPLTAHILNTPENSQSDASDQLWYRIGFSDGRNVMLVLSGQQLATDSKGAYKESAFALLQDWHANGGPPTIELCR